MNYLLRLFNRHDEAYFISQNERPEERNKAAQLITGKSDMFHKNDPGNIAAGRLAAKTTYKLSVSGYECQIFG